MKSVRVKVLSFRCPLRALPRWREARACVEHGHLVVRFLLRGAPVGELCLPLRTLSDVSNLPFLPPGSAALRFSLPAGEHVLALRVGKNPLIYSVEEYEYLLHLIFSAALGGVSLGLSREGKVYERASIKLMPGELILIGSEPVYVRHLDNSKVIADDDRKFFLNASERALRLMRRYLERYKPKIEGD
ncbi:hypothetical protein [Palaeococcus ferrophilus]|uniref:hypothetical protein n=1 Tax=Palaeococcus ferrophilus TaxID=83868 RepID=UPI00064F2BA0|nr:hypothetical protein [Palaeococcus ferrophilus]